MTCVCIFFQIVFAVLGMELFMDSFGSCTDETIKLRKDCSPENSHRSLSMHAFEALRPSGRDLTHPMYNPEKFHWLIAENTLANLIQVKSSSPPAMPRTLKRSAPPLHEDVGDTEESDVNELTWSAAQKDAAYLARLDNGLVSEHGRELPNATYFLSARRRLKGGGRARGGGGALSDLPIQWLNPPFGSFDDFGSAMLILYIASTGDGWEDFMFRGMDVTGPGTGPERHDFSPLSLYFIMWLMVGTFTTINLFVGSVVDNFTKIKADIEGSATLTKEQRQWQRTMQESHKKEPPPRQPQPPESPVLRPFFDLVSSKGFDIFITVVILCNIMTMALDYHRIEEDLAMFSFYTNAMAAFGNIYYGECALKLLGFGVGYFRDGWNRFDFFLVCTSLLDQFAADTFAKFLPVPPMLLRILRVARIMRILRLLKGFKGLRDLLMTMVLSFPSFVNVGGLLLLVTFIYAVLGVQLFTFVKSGEAMNDQRNFDSFPSAYLVLLQCLTGDNWSGLMYDAMVGPERGCDPDAQPVTDCGSALAIPFFISYTILGAFVLLNLIVAVILENFTALGDIRPDLVSASDIADFGEAWAEYDVDVSGSITESELADLLLLVPPPLGFAGIMSLPDSKETVRRMELIPEYDGRVGFETVVDGLVQRSYEANDVEMPTEVAKEAAAARLNKVSSIDAVPPLDRIFSKGAHLHGDPSVVEPPAPPPPPPPPSAKLLPREEAPMSAERPASGYSGHSLCDSSSADMRAVVPAQMPAVRRPGVPDHMKLPAPERLPPPSNGAAGDRPLMNGKHAPLTVAPPRPPPGQPPPLPQGWYKATKGDLNYYFNVETRQVSWQPPIEWLRAERRRRRQQSPNGSLRKGWDA